MILSNMPGGKAGNKTNDTYSAQRAAIKAAGADVHDRFMASGHIGHNKFQVLSRAGPPAVLFGSTNVTAHGLCAQTNNTIIARSPGIAGAYDAYWNRLQTDTSARPGDGPQEQTPKDIERQEAQPGRPGRRQRRGRSMVLAQHAQAESQQARTERGLSAGPAGIFKLISQAQQAVLFLVFEPGYPSIVDTIAAAQKANPSLFVRGAVTASGASGEFYTAITATAMTARKEKGDPPLPEDYRVIHTRGVTKGDAFGQWEAELNQAGHAVIHDKIVVIDPFSDTCVVLPGATTTATRPPTTTTRTSRSSGTTAPSPRLMRRIAWTSMTTTRGAII